MIKSKITLIILIATFILNNIQAQVDKPIDNFESLWNDLNQGYAFFEEKNINWNEIYAKYSLLINEATSDDSLFEVCCSMIRELDDMHTRLIDKKTGKRCNSGKPIRLLKEFPNNDSLKLLVNTIDSTLLKYGFKDLTRIRMKIPYLYGNVIEYADNGKFGYVRINLMFGISKKKLSQVLENIVDDFNTVGGVIIDVRFNSGGYDKYSFNIAGKFVNEKRIGHYKCKKTKNGFTDLKVKYLEPVGKKQIIKPIVILTSDQSMSATDIFALIMKDLPYVTIVGDNTKGIFSDIKEYKLPNGWRYTFSSQKYLSVDMKNYEGIGISPDIKILNTKQDLINGEDPLLIKAIEVLNR